MEGARQSGHSARTVNGLGRGTARRTANGLARIRVVRKGDGGFDIRMRGPARDRTSQRDGPPVDVGERDRRCAYAACDREAGRARSPRTANSFEDDLGPAIAIEAGLRSLSTFSAAQRVGIDRASSSLPDEPLHPLRSLHPLNPYSLRQRDELERLSRSHPRSSVKNPRRSAPDGRVAGPHANPPHGDSSHPELLQAAR